MKKLNLNDVADEFDMIGPGTCVFYNKETGEFGFNMNSADHEYDDSGKFEDSCWVSAPDLDELDGYKIMTDFVETVEDPHANELLRVSLEGKGAFGRFRDSLRRVDLEKEWYAFKHDAYVRIAGRWCEYNDIPYE